MIDASKLLGVDVMTGHWEFTYGAERVKAVVEKDFAGKLDFVAQNVKTADFGDPVFPPYVIKSLGGVPVAIVGQAFPYTPIANPRYFVPEWTFGIQEENLQKVVDEARGKGAQVVVLLSHNGMDVDLKLASRVQRDRRDPRRPHARRRAAAVDRQQSRRPHAGHERRQQRQVPRRARPRRQGRQSRRLPLPAAAGVLEPAAADAAMSALIEKVRAPYRSKLARAPRDRGRPACYPARQLQRHVGPGDLRRAMAEKGAQIAFSPGFPLGHDAPAGRGDHDGAPAGPDGDHLPDTTVNTLSGEAIKTILEDVADNLFNPDPYYQQGGDMVRVGGMRYAIDPTAAQGKRITRMEPRRPRDRSVEDLQGRGLGAGRRGARAGGEPVWETVARYMRARSIIKPRKLNLPALDGVEGNPGIG